MLPITYSVEGASTDAQVVQRMSSLLDYLLYVIDREGILRYRGSVDDMTFRKKIPTRFFLDEAVESLLEAHLPALTESPAYGCTIVREV